MISKKMSDALNGQINKEMFSSYLYLAMSAYCQHEGLSGVANWMKIQAQEEMLHAMRFYQYMESQGAQIALQAIEAPPTTFKSALHLFQETLKHEQFITKSIQGLADLAQKEKDHATSIMLQWFITEQIEEEANATDILNKFKMVGNSSQGIWMIDRELAARQPSAGPAAAEA